MCEGRAGSILSENNVPSAGCAETDNHVGNWSDCIKSRRRPSAIPREPTAQHDPPRDHHRPPFGAAP